MSQIGFHSLVEQVTTRRIRHGIAFNVMVVGATGIGKTTLINTLFDFDFNKPTDLVKEFSQDNLKIREFSPKNNHINIKFSVIETDGFNDQLDRSFIYEPIVDYIDEQFEEYFINELQLGEYPYKNISDTRVHCCIYMISPIDSGLNAVDLACLKQLHKKVCLIPIIGKSDILNQDEILALKEKVRQQLKANNIEIYEPDEAEVHQRPPLAIAASNEVVVENGKRKRVRIYPWGRMYVKENSEFPDLERLVLRTNMISLIDATHQIHYEKYRDEITSEGKENKKLTNIEEEISCLKEEITTIERS